MSCGRWWTKPWAKKSCGAQGMFNVAFVRRLLNEHWSGKADNRKTLWTLFSFQLWYDRWGK